MAEETAVTKNLQRKDATPIEKANTYQKLIESGTARHSVFDRACPFYISCEVN